MDGFPTFTTDILLHLIRKMPPDVFHRTVRYLFLGLTLWPFDRAVIETERTILAACTGVTNLLAAYRLSPHEDLLQNLPLQHLTFRLDELFPLRADFSHSIFHHVTHLHLLSVAGPQTAVEWADLALIPHLTHFAFNDIGLCALLTPVLRACARFQCVVLLCTSYNASDNAYIQRSGITEDVRFVLMNHDNFILDWQLGAYGCDTYWDFAELLIGRKRAGKVGCESLSHELSFIR